MIADRDNGKRSGVAGRRWSNKKVGESQFLHAGPKPAVQVVDRDIAPPSAIELFKTTESALELGLSNRGRSSAFPVVRGRDKDLL